MASKRHDGKRSFTLADLYADPTYWSNLQAGNKARQQVAEEIRELERPVVEDLRAAGFSVSSPWELIGQPEPYHNAIPILLDHLQQSQDPRVRSAISSALAVPYTRKYWHVLVRLFEDSPSSEGPDSLKSYVATIISIVADDGVVDDVIRLLEDRRHGVDRIRLIDALLRSSNERAKVVLEGLTNDSVIGDDVKRILTRGNSEVQYASEQVVDDKLVETSANFAAEDVEPFLLRLGCIVSGFGPAAVAKVVRVLESMKPDEERSMAFNVKFQGCIAPLQIIVHLDDVDSPDLAFLAPADLAVRISQLLET